MKTTVAKRLFSFILTMMTINTAFGQVTIGPAGGNATIDCTATPVFTPPTASSTCSGVTVNLLGDATTGNSCTKTITRRWDATDACGNHSATVSQAITIADFTAPTYWIDRT